MRKYIICIFFFISLVEFPIGPRWRSLRLQTAAAIFSTLAAIVLETRMLENITVNVASRVSLFFFDRFCVVILKTLNKLVMFDLTNWSFS